MPQQPWWEGAVGYEIYPRSFADSNGDGIGDLEGIRRRLPYLEWLGIDAIWIAPFYESPGFDHGYDVADYLAVHPIHGDLGDFDALVAEAHSRNIRVLVDVVPNHSSSHHEWFRRAQRGADDPYRDYYIWKDPAPDGGPPNNWVSHFGGPAWTRDEASGQYYCHLFLPEQPDFNWANPAVRNEFDSILRFWCERGVDGFRIDVAHALMKDPEFRDNPQLRPVTEPGDPRDVFTAYDHLYDLDQDATVEIFRRWNRVVAPYGAMLIGETGPDDPHRLARYVAGGDALHTGFYLTPVWHGWEPAVLLANLREVHSATGGQISWVINNHDSSRSVTRFGGGDRARYRSLAVTTLLMALGGVPFLYQGEELGLADGEIEPDDFEDPIAVRNTLSAQVGKQLWGGVVGRDGCRTAMPWDDSNQNGFTTAATAWLQAALRPAGETVARQREMPDSFLTRYRELLRLRRSLPQLWAADLMWIDTADPECSVLRRGDVIVVANLGRRPASPPLEGGKLREVFSSCPNPPTEPADDWYVAPETTLILQTADSSRAPN